MVKIEEELTMKFKQLSIYDFLQEAESQEVAPSEMLPQVDEAQVVLNSFDDDGDYRKYPSSDLDTTIPTEDTDLSLFSVGDKFKVVSASSLYDTDIDPESYYYLLDYQGKTLEVKSIGDCYVITVGGQIFNFNEIIKI